MKDPFSYRAEHTDMIRVCHLSFLSSPVDCDMVFIFFRTCSTNTQRMTGNSRWRRATSLGTAVCKKKRIMRRLTFAFRLVELKPLITAMYSKKSSKSHLMLFCIDL